MAFSSAALAYEEPAVTDILIHASFLLLLNVLNWVLNAVLYCGLVGQILVGMAWGTPGADLLSLDAQKYIVQVGYLGLILLVYEGGLSVSLTSMRANMALAVGVAATGIAVPIGLSFVLLRLVDGTSRLSAFAAGAALCSTSLGTAFTVLRASGLASTRLGVVLSGAAMLDDVVGLVMVQVISSLGSSGGSVPAVTILRPILVAVALVVIAVVLCRLVVQPVARALHGWRAVHPDAPISRLLHQRPTALVLHTFLLVALVVGASYAETSNLFAAYVAGAVVSWWDSEAISRNGMTFPTSGPSVFAHYYEPAAKWILQPFFFASIGFSIPITKMFRGSIVWKGLVYAGLMCLGKLVCGLWLVRWGAWNGKKTAEPTTKSNGEESPKTEPVTGESSPPEPASRNVIPDPPKPLSLYPAAILGLAMVPRGEIGFLISAVAQSHGVLGEEQSSGESDIFLIVTWAIVLCTVLGPPCVGLLVRRVKRLEQQAAASENHDNSARDVLGVWGISSSP